jgi:hypothetical protein
MLGRDRVKEAYRQTFTVPSTSGSYAPERIAFGEVPAGLPPDSFQGVTAVVLTTVASMVVELWLPRVGITSGAHIDTDYVYSGQALDAATGGETFVLAGYPGAQIRVKSGGTGGSAVVSASAF